jgi:hydrogenase nickel incorporation protein HypA/HybF
MHEYSIIQALLARVTDEAESRGASAVHRLHLRIGELSGVEIDLLEKAFLAFRGRSLCNRAELEIHPVTAEWSCPRCQRPTVPGGFLRCPECGVPARLARGDEIVLDRIEMEVP